MEEAGPAEPDPGACHRHKDENLKHGCDQRRHHRASPNELERPIKALRRDEEAAEESAEPAVPPGQLEKGRPYGKMLCKK